jgi:adenosylmethionine-8-amino-7-oxononanoate aminotransferase
MHQVFSKTLPVQLFAERPDCRFGEPCSDAEIADITQRLSQHAHEIAAVIIEPIVQGAGGMHFYSADYLRRLHQLCKQHDVLLIADEVATGFGRTGKLFACEHADIAPDILCVGKALTGGMMTLAATLCTDDIANAISNSAIGTFMHGPTFMGNPLACATALASIQLLLDHDWQADILRIEAQLQHHLAPARSIRGVVDVRILGAIGVIELDTPVDMPRWQPALVDAGVWVRPFGKLVYIMPAYIMSNEELRTLCNALVTVTRHMQETT